MNGEKVDCPHPLTSLVVQEEEGQNGYSMSWCDDCDITLSDTRSASVNKPSEKDLAQSAHFT